MEENNYEHNETTTINHEKPKHDFSWLKCLLIGLLVFIAAFCAFYTVADWHMKRILDPAYHMRKFDKAIMKQEQQLEKISRNEFRMQDKMDTKTEHNQFIRAEKLNDAYRIVIDLRPFGNNPDNVQVRTEGKMLVIDAAGEKNTRNKKEIVEYSQAFAFGDDIKTNEITKVHEGSNYIITVPFD